MVSHLLRLTCLLLASLSASATIAAVSAQLSAHDIDELESVRLTVRASETRQTETLDLSALEKDFHVMGTNTSSQYRFVNGREQSWVDYQITLQPKRVGELTVPSIALGRDVTPSMTLRVRRLSDDTRSKIDAMVFFEMDVSSSSIYVQAQLVLTRRLLYSQGVQLYSDLPGAPEIEDAVVKTLGETTSSTTTREGQAYGVVEQQYAIFPESSGTFTIPGISITASVRLVEQGRVSRKGVRVGTEEVKVTVLPVPATYPNDQPWLPAQDVSALQMLSEDKPPVAVGNTLIHELLIHIIGNVGSVAPPQVFPGKAEEFRQYPQSPVINDDTNGGQVAGSRLQTTSIVPVVPGDLIIPAQTIYWWDTIEDTLRATTTEAIVLNATGPAIIPETQPQPDLDSTAELAEPEPDTSIVPDFSLPDLSRAQWLTGLVATIGIMLLIWLIRLLSSAIPKWYAKRPSRHVSTRKLRTQRDPKLFYNGLSEVLRSRAANSKPDRRVSIADALALFEASDSSLADPMANLRNHLFSENSNDQKKTSPFSEEDKLAISHGLDAFLLKRTKKTSNKTLPPLYATEQSNAY
jgi:hypothetical protein